MPIPAPTSSDRSRRVLLVDPDDDNRAMYRECLVPAGWEVAESRDGREGLVHALAIKPSAVITEIWLPFIDGIALCELLRGDRATSLVPIIVVTAETRASELARASCAGADAVFVKPTTPDVIAAEIERLIIAAQQPGGAGRQPPTPSNKRTSLVKAHVRLATTTPDTTPTALLCPLCMRPLHYKHTFIGGVSRHQPERWDYYDCRDCGEFQYRYRTRKLRAM